MSTVSNHLATAIKKGLPVYLDILGISSDLIWTVYEKIEENNRGNYHVGATEQAV